MTKMPFQPDIKITELFNRHEFTVSAEVIPPRNGSQQAEVLGQIDSLKRSGAQFLSVTKGAGGSLRGGSLPIAQAIKESFGVPCIAHFTCRDLVPAEVENQLVDHHYFGIRNILALRGDPPLNQPDWVGRPESYPYAYQLIEQIMRMNKGQYLDRPGYNVDGREATDFCVGAAVYPEHPDTAEALSFFQAKVEAGAEYAITQMIFDVDRYSQYLDRCARFGISVPVLPGTRILKTQKQAARMAERFQVAVPDGLMKMLPLEDSPANTNQVLDVFLGFVETLKKAGAPGIHLFVLSDTELSSLALKRLSTK